jgi:hypothetical protein
LKPTWWRVAMLTNSARDSASIFRIMLPRCALTVISLIPSSLPTCLFGKPTTTDAITSRSRAVRHEYRAFKYRISVERSSNALLRSPDLFDHRMRPHDVDHGIPAELREMVGADNGVVISAPNIVHTRFKLDHIVDTRLISRRPIHPAHDATQWESFRAPGRSRHLFECCNRDSQSADFNQDL